MISPFDQELEATDHSTMNYEEFRKNFYVEVPELARITDAELADIHLSLDNMQVRGKGPPKPIKTWIQAGISMKILGESILQAGPFVTVSKPCYIENLLTNLLVNLVIQE